MFQVKGSMYLTISKVWASASIGITLLLLGQRNTRLSYALLNNLTTNYSVVAILANCVCVLFKMVHIVTCLYACTLM